MRDEDDLRTPEILSAIRRTTDSKWALMDSTGYVATVGEFIEESGNLYSNGTFRAAPVKTYRVTRSFFDDEEFDY